MTTNTDAVLRLPCPFCGSAASSETLYDINRNRGEDVTCSNDQCFLFLSGPAFTPDGWNKRTTANGAEGHLLEKFRSHSVMLNRFAWQLSEAIGDIPDGQEAQDVDLGTLLTRVVDAIKQSRAPVADVPVAVARVISNYEVGDQGPESRVAWIYNPMPEGAELYELTPALCGRTGGA